MLIQDNGKCQAINMTNMRMVIVEPRSSGSGGVFQVSSGERSRVFFPAWAVCVLVCLLVAGTFTGVAAQNAAAVPPIPDEAQRNHIVVLIDQSGSFQRLVRDSSQLTDLLGKTLPAILTDSRSLKGQKIYDRERDVLSVMLFGITTEYPRIDSGLLRDVFLFEENAGLRDLSSSNIGWREQRAGLSAISAVFGMALDRIGSEYRRMSLETVFNKTYLVRISDDIHNSSGGFYGELTTIQRFRDTTYFKPDVLGFQTVYQKLSACDAHIEIMNPNHTCLVSLSRRGRVSWDPDDYVTPAGDYPVKVLITEARPRAYVDFDALFESRTTSELKHRTQSPVSATARFQLRPDYRQSHPDLVALGWRKDVLYTGGSAWDHGELQPMSPDSVIEYEVIQKDSTLPVNMDFTAFFGRKDDYLGRGLFRVQKRLTYFEESLSEVDVFLMSICPFEGLSKNWVFGGFVTLMILMLLCVVFSPRRAILAIEPVVAASGDPTRIVVDLDERSANPIIVGYAERSDTNYSRPRLRLSAKIKDFFYSLRNEKTSTHLRFGNEATTDGKTAVLRDALQPALPKPIGELRFRSDEPMALRLFPRSIVDLTERGRQDLVGTTGVTRESTLEFDFDGRFGWTQGRRRAGQSSRQFRAKLVLLPRRNHARVAVHEADPIEFGGNHKHVIAVIDMDSLEPDFNYITDMDVTLQAELELLGTAFYPELSFAVVPAEIAPIVAGLRLATHERMKLQDGVDGDDSQMEESLARIETDVTRVLIDKVITLGADSPVSDIQTAVVSEIRTIVDEEWTAMMGPRSVDRAISRVYAGGPSETETAASMSLTDPHPSGDKTGFVLPESELEEVLSGAAPAINRLLSERWQSLVAESQRSKDQEADGSSVSEGTADNQGIADSAASVSALPTPRVICHDPDRSCARADIVGRIGSQGLQLVVAATFTDLKNLKAQIEYNLHLSVPVGRDQLDMLGADGKTDTKLPVVPVSFIPSRKLATARVEYYYPGVDSKSKIVNLMKLKRNDIIDADRAGRHARCVLPHGGRWLKAKNPDIILGNNARSGEGRVEFTVGFKEATVVTGIDRPDPGEASELRRAIEVYIQDVAHGNAPRSIAEKFNLARLDNRIVTVESAEGAAHLRLSFFIRPDDLNLGENDDVKVALILPLTISINNPGADSDMSCTEKLSLSIPFYLHREPARGLLSIDFGTSAIAAAYSDGKLEDSLLNLQESRRALDPMNLLINNEPQDGSRFLSGPLGVYSEEKESLFSDEEGALIQKQAKVAFPATRRFRDIPEYLIPHLKMLLASGVNMVTLGQNDDVEMPIQELLKHALGRLLKDFVLRQVGEVAESQSSDEILQNLRRIVMTVPNTSLGHQTTMLKDALPSDNGFRFAEDYIDFLSESDAAAYGYLYQHETQKTLSQFGESFTLLVYDCGAGTLDLSLRTVKIDQESGTGELHPTSTLLSLLSIEGAGNALDSKIMECVEEQLRSAASVKELSDKYSFKVNYYPFDPIDKVLATNIPVDLWRDYMYLLKRDLYFTKKNLSEAAAGGDIDRDDLEVRVGFVERTHPMFDIAKAGGLGDDDKATIKKHGITFGYSQKNPVVVFPYNKLQDRLSEDGGFYHDHIDLPLEALLHGREDAGGWPDVVLLTGRTALFPGFRERLEEWFEKELKALPEEPMESDSDLADLSPDEVSGVDVPSVPKFVSFENDPEKMKSIVVQGALAHAGSGGGGFETTKVYGYYGLLVRASNEWKWYPVCSHHTVQDAIDNVGAPTPCGSCSLRSVVDISFVYSSIDPKVMIEKYNADLDRPIADKGPLWAYRHFMKGHASVAGVLYRQLADEHARASKVRLADEHARANNVRLADEHSRASGGRLADEIQFYGSYSMEGRILNVSVDLQTGGYIQTLSTDADRADIGRERYSVWPYNLWSKA